jgi:hypothetical protein
LVGFDLLMDFALEVGAVLGEEARRRRIQAEEALIAVAERQASILLAANPADAFVATLRTLIVQGRVSLLGRDQAHAPGEKRGEVVGWQDETFAYLLPDAARRAVSTFVRESGDSWPYTPTTLHRALVSAGIVMPGPDGRPETQARVGGEKRRVLKVPLERLQLGEQSAIPSPLSPPADTIPTHPEDLT